MPRWGYGSLSVFLAAAAIAAALYAGALGNQCGPAYALNPLILILFFGFWLIIPMAALLAVGVFKIGHSTKRNGVLVIAIAFVAALFALVVVVHTPHHYLPADSNQCRIDL